MARRWRKWSEDDVAVLSSLARTGVTNRMISQALDRTEAAVAQMKFKLDLVVHPATCQWCRKDIKQPNTVGRPRRHCSEECIKLATAERRNAEREITRTAVNNTRADWRCKQCHKDLPQDNVLRVYCSKTCGNRAWYERALENGTR